ncbi:MSHA biogenesis protein MshA, partial [Vibrio parahaemolyticus]
GLSGAIQGASGIVYGKAAIQGVESSTTAVNVDLGNNVNVSTKFGYPVATAAELEKVIDGIGADEDFVQIQTGGAEADNDQWVTFGI